MILSTIEKYEIKLTAPYICMAFFYYPKKEMAMLTIRSKSISLSGDSKVNDQVIFAFQASINSNNPKEVQFSNWINDHELYKQNRKECNADYESFQDEVYKLQDSMLLSAETL
nr:MAG TPA: hypothetical protein [Bacteriophage sp.]